MDDERFHVTEAPRRPGGRLFSGPSVAACLEWVAARSSTGGTRLAIWAASPPPEEGADVALCMPVGVVEDWRDLAEHVVDRWETAWLLIESAPRRHRAEARDALVELLAGALSVAAATGLDDPAEPHF